MNAINQIKTSPLSVFRDENVIVIRADNLPKLGNTLMAMRPYVCPSNIAAHIINYGDLTIADALSSLVLLRNADLEARDISNDKLDILMLHVRAFEKAELTISHRDPKTWRGPTGKVTFGCRSQNGNEMADAADISEMMFELARQSVRRIYEIYDLRFIKCYGVKINRSDDYLVESNGPYHIDLSGDLVTDDGVRLLDLIVPLPEYGARVITPNPYDARRHILKQTPAAMRMVLLPPQIYQDIAVKAKNENLFVDEFICNTLQAIA